MRLVRILFALLITFFASAYTIKYYSWSSLASNQHISLNNLRDAVDNGIFNLRNIIPTGTRRITKADAEYYLYLNESFAPYVAKASNQHVTKADLQANTTYTILVYGIPGFTCEEAVLYLVANTTLPCDATLTFDWCADNGASGSYTLTIPGGQSTVSQSINTHTYGGIGCVGTDVRIKPIGLVFSNTCSPDPHTWKITSDNWDNGCNYALPASTNTICVKGCPNFLQ